MDYAGCGWIVRQIYKVVFFILIFLFSKPAFAQNLTLDVPDVNKVRTIFDIGTSKEELAAPLENPSKRIKTPDLRLITTFNNPEFRDYWTLYAREPRHYVSRVDYLGFHGVVHNQICRLAMRYYNQKASIYFNSLALTYHPLEYFKRMDQFSLDSSDSDYRWWERSYQDSFSISRGGSIAESQTVGEELEIINIGPLRLSNSGKLSWENHSLDVTTSTEPTTTKNGEKSLPLPEDLLLSKRRLLFGIRVLQNLLQTENYNITGNIRLNLRADQFSPQNKSGVSGYVKFTAFYKHNPWLEVDIRGTARPLVKEYGLEFSIQLLCF